MMMIRNNNRAIVRRISISAMILLRYLLPQRLKIILQYLMNTWQHQQIISAV